jgi:hypothetical protein
MFVAQRYKQTFFRWTRITHLPVPIMHSSPINLSPHIILIHSESQQKQSYSLQENLQNARDELLFLVNFHPAKEQSCAIKHQQKA